MVVGEVVINFFEVGKKYKIAMFDEDGVGMECKCKVIEKDSEEMRLELFEKNGTVHNEKIWVEWKDLQTFEEIQ